MTFQQSSKLSQNSFAIDMKTIVLLFGVYPIWCWRLHLEALQHRNNMSTQGLWSTHCIYCQCWCTSILISSLKPCAAWTWMNKLWELWPQRGLVPEAWPSSLNSTFRTSTAVLGSQGINFQWFSIQTKATVSPFSPSSGGKSFIQSIARSLSCRLERTD